MDGSKEPPKTTGGLIGDKYSHLCLIDQEAARSWKRVGCAPPRGLQAALFFGAASYAHSNRGRDSLALGKQGTGRMRPRGPDGDRP